MATLTTRKQQREHTQTTILAAAENQFITNGFHNTTIRNIAADAGVSTGSVMSVGDKNTLLVRIFDTKIAAIHDTRANTFTITDTNPADALIGTVQPFLEVFNEHQDLAREYFSILVRGSHNSDIFDELADHLKGEFTKLIAHFRTHPDPESAAEALYLGFLGVLVVWAGNADQQPHTYLYKHAQFFFQGAA